jgi:tetraacyldisaccharide 4'-kinase
MRAPDIWQRTDWRARLAVAGLAPLGWLYNAAVALKARRAKPFRAPVPVICVGNLTAGGTGKTPIAIAIAEALKTRGDQPFFLTRGHGGALRGPVRVMPGHTAADVGDEPLLLAETAPVIVARNRAQGAVLAAAEGADVLVMDDGHQNFTLAKDLSLIVIDAQEQFGNGQVLPAGPLREYPAQGLARADAVIVVGDGDAALPTFAGPRLRAHIAHAEVPQFKGAPAVAFAGIGRPEKFFHSLRACGAEIRAEVRFPDHHVYTPAEIARLKASARRHGALLITTGKDYVRLTEIERTDVLYLPVRATFENDAALAALLDKLPAPL